MTVSRVAGDGDALTRVQRENETLYAVIKTVSSSLDLDRVLGGIVDIATDATGCHACFIYFLEDDRLELRAASPLYSKLVGRLGWGIEEGLTGWVARTKTPEFIRDHAMDDPRMKFVPELEEEQFQSMVAVPILARDGRRDRRDRAPHRRAARVRRRRAQLPRAHGLARGGRDRERAAVRGHAPACGGAHHAHAALAGARGGDAPGGPLRRRDSRRPPAPRRRRLPDLARGHGRGRAEPGRRGSARQRAAAGPRGAAARPHARRAHRGRGRRAGGGLARGGRRAARHPVLHRARAAPSTRRTPSCCARWRTRPRWA